jgi:hypothetical protein
MKPKKPISRAVAKKSPTVGGRIIEGLEEALAWSKGEDLNAPNAGRGKTK